MNILTNGIILREQSIGERDKLITALTEEKGLIKGFAKGAKKIKSQNCAGTQLFSYSRLCLVQGRARDTYTVTEAKSLEMFYGLRNDIENMCLAQYFCELVTNVLAEGQKNKTVMSLILNSFFVLAKNLRSASFVKPCFELRLMSDCGYMPDLTMCQYCGKYEKEFFYFIPSLGKLYCSDCVTPDSIPPYVRLNSGVTKALRHIVYADEKQLFSFALSSEGLVALSRAAEEYVLHLTERNFKTLDFYKELKNNHYE